MYTVLLVILPALSWGHVYCSISYSPCLKLGMYTVLLVILSALRWRVHYLKYKLFITCGLHKNALTPTHVYEDINVRARTGRPGAARVRVRLCMKYLIFA